jgi:hypothetical protein
VYYNFMYVKIQRQTGCFSVGIQCSSYRVPHKNCVLKVMDMICVWNLEMANHRGWVGLLLGWDTRYPNWSFLWFSSFPPSKSQDSILVRPWLLLSNSPFFSHFIIWYCIVLILIMSSTNQPTVVKCNHHEQQKCL